MFSAVFTESLKYIQDYKYLASSCSNVIVIKPNGNEEIKSSHSQNLIYYSAIYFLPETMTPILTDYYFLPYLNMAVLKFKIMSAMKIQSTTLSMRSNIGNYSSSFSKDNRNGIINIAYMIKIIQNISHNNLVYPVGDNIN
jgi:hypothetical protein